MNRCALIVPTAKFDRVVSRANDRQNGMIADSGNYRKDIVFLKIRFAFKMLQFALKADKSKRNTIC